jgi:uncharacterized membrane protein YdjX (TVP38/TMEM64 family)
MTILRTKSKKRIHIKPSQEITATDLHEYAGTTARDKLLGVCILVVFTALFFWFTLVLCRPLFLLAYSPEKFNRFIQDQGALGRMAFLGFQVLQGFLPIPLELTAAAGGYAFGRLQGALLTLCSSAISTTLIFYFTKAFGHRLIDLFFTRKQQRGARFLRNSKLRDTLTWIVFLIPGTPKRVFVFSAGLVPGSFKKFLAVSTLARAPSLVACSFGGYALFSGNYTQAAIIFAILGICSIAGIAAYKRITKKRRHKASEF